MAAYRFSVVVPTYQRRDLVTSLVQRLDEQQFEGAFEVVVVVDGSTDGTAEGLRALCTGRPLRVVEQPRNLGLSEARNRGAREASGELVLYLDDDMEPDADLLAEHDRSHHGGPGTAAVFGAYPLHPHASSRTVVAEFIGAYADELSRRLEASEPRWSDVVGGQLSVPRAVILEVGGFDPECFGNEDWEFGYRLVLAGHALRYNPRAVSYQRYAATAQDALVKQRRRGRADVALVRKHPELHEEVFPASETLRRRRLVPRAAAAAPGLTSAVLAALGPMASARLERGARDLLSRRTHGALALLAYWHGVRDAGGVPTAR